MNVFLHLPPLISTGEKLKPCLEQGTTTEQINEFQLSAGIHRSVLKPHQVKHKSLLWTPRWREIQTHTFPWLKSLSPNAADAWWELCSTNRSSGTGGWREMWRKTWGKTATKEAKSNIILLFLSPSASLTSCCISRGWDPENHIFHLDQSSIFRLVVDQTVSVLKGFTDYCCIWLLHQELSRERNTWKEQDSQTKRAKESLVIPESVKTYSLSLGEY